MQEIRKHGARQQRCGRATGPPGNRTSDEYSPKKFRGAQERRKRSRGGAGTAGYGPRANKEARWNVERGISGRKGQSSGSIREIAAAGFVAKYGHRLVFRP
jgi:hypothetical protein